MKRPTITLLFVSALVCPTVAADASDEDKAIKVLESTATPVEKEAACRQLKRIGTIEFTNRRPPDYWAERGYDWHARF